MNSHLGHLGVDIELNPLSLFGKKKQLPYVQSSFFLLALHGLPLALQTH